MVVIGITGPTGAGKTTALRELEGMGVAVIDCDAVYHELTRSCVSMLSELRFRFGEHIFDSHGGVRRRALGAIVFENAAALADLNAITHRYVSREVKRAIDRAEKAGRPAVAIDAIALLESGLAEACDCTVAVTASAQTRVGRVMARDGIGEEYARLRISAQQPSEYFEARCHHTLRNDGEDSAEFAGRARALFQHIISQGG